LVAPHGGIRPAQRRRSRLALTLAEREVISRGVTAHHSARSIAKLLGRSPSTVSREMSRNGDYDSYRAALADEKAWARARRPKCLQIGEQSATTTGRGGEAQVGLVARADSRLAEENEASNQLQTWTRRYTQPYPSQYRS
jgi:DNA-binding CsgD family transcriptional regulator